jgi:ABC-type branched-subunit amino acid transport system ATPase component
MRAPMLAIVSQLGRFREEEMAAVQEAEAALDFVGLGGRASDDASSLSYGDQRRLEIARAIVSRPSLLLLDEPAAGLNPSETAHLAALVRRIRDGGTTILLVEHDMTFVMQLSDCITVLNFGKRIFEGTPDEVRRSPAVVEAYLGPKVAARLEESARA